MTKFSKYITTGLFIVLAYVLLAVLPASADSGKITGSVVNVRTGPGTNHEIAGTLYQDAEVSILESSNGWYKIQRGSLTGWISANLVEAKQKLIYLKVKAELANLRAGPDTSYAKTGQAVKGDSLQLLDVQGEWYKVKAPDGSTAYVAAYLVETAEGTSNSGNNAVSNPGTPDNTPPTAENQPAATPVATTQKQIKVISGPINIRSGPGSTYNKVGTIDENQTYPVLSQEGEWYKIQLTNSSAYVAGWLVQEINAPAPSGNTTASSSTNNAAPQVYMDQKLLSFDVPPIIENDRTLVPLRAIFEAMGATVNWDNSTRTVTSTKGTTTVILTIGSLAPTVNGQVWNLDVPAKIKGDRTLAPLRFVGEAFGGTVDWDGATRTISIASPAQPASTPEKKAIAATVTSELVNLRTGPSTTYAKIDEARSGERMEILTERDGWYQVSRGGRIAWISGELVQVAWQENEPEAVPVTTPSTNPKPNSENTTSSSPENIRMLSSKSEDGFKIIIGSGVQLRGKLDESSSNLRYKFEDRKIEGNTIIRETIGGQVIEARAEQQDRDAVIYISLPAEFKYRTSSEDGGKKEVITISNYIQNIERKTFGSKGERIILNAPLPIAYTTNQQGTRMEVELPNMLRGSAQTEYTFTSDLILSIRLSEKQINGETGTVMIIETKNPAKYAFGKSAEGNQLHILFVDQREVQQTTAAIVIDPGHGGKETGAIGSWMKEKDPNLDISLKVANILRQRGMEVVLTRDDDSYVSLEDRSSMANLYNARLFVSIHNNGNTSSDKQGTETHYYAPLDNPELFMQSAERKRLATCIQEQMVSKLRRTDRGVKTGAGSNFSVLRNTQMPSVLAEVVFITNPEEEQLLQQDYFKTLAAEAIADGITQYCGSSYSDIKI